MKRYSTSLVITEMQIKTFINCHFTLVRRAIIKNLQTINAEEKREPSYTIDGNINWYSHYEVQYGGFLKI